MEAALSRPADALPLVPLEGCRRPGGDEASSSISSDDDELEDELDDVERCKEVCAPGP